MASTVGHFNSKMQRQRRKYPGWAAFDQKHRDKEYTEPGPNVDPFPPLSKTQDPMQPMNHRPEMRTFSSVVHDTMDFPSISHRIKVGNLDDGRGRNPSEDISNQVAVESNAMPSIKTLKSLHGWADESLIDDILAEVDNDVEQASALLNAMVSNDFDKEEIVLQKPSTVFKAPTSEKKDSIFLDNQSSKERFRELLSLNSSVPLEPEWEEDDVYSCCRKDAIRMMRLASQHSRAASTAFQRGDHLSAHQFSLKAREQWISAEKLNAKAAEEILHIRNCKNDVWNLDLHGLHALEAVNILKEHLHRIETHAPVKHSASVDGMKKLEKEPSCYPSLASGSGLDMEAPSNKQQAFFQQRKTFLHIVTGTGNHSRGQAALPTAVRSFLIDNGYRFDDARPGVIAVRPKFRHHLTARVVS